MGGAVVGVKSNHLAENAFVIAAYEPQSCFCVIASETKSMRGDPEKNCSLHAALFNNSLLWIATELTPLAMTVGVQDDDMRK